MESDPRSAEALAVLGLAQLGCGEWQKAESGFNEAVAIDSLSPEAHLGLAIIASAEMRSRDAIAHLGRATSSELFPGAAYRALGLAFEDADLHQEASRAMRKAAEYPNEIPADQLANVRAFADIFAAYGSRSLYGMPKSLTSTSVHFEYSGGHIIVPGVLNGSKHLDFVLDTGQGGSLLISSDYAEGLNLTYLGEIKTITLYGDIHLKAAVLDSFGIGGLVMRDVPILVAEDSPFGSIGLIGWKVIQRLNTAIDFEKSEIRFSTVDYLAPRETGMADKGRAECVPFIYLSSMFVIARFGDDTPKAFVFDTGAVASYLHSSDAQGPDGEQTDSPCSIQIGDLTFNLPHTRFLDFSAIHRTGRYYFPGVIGGDILRHSVVSIFPGKSMLCIEKSTP